LEILFFVLPCHLHLKKLSNAITFSYYLLVQPLHLYGSTHSFWIGWGSVRRWCHYGSFSWLCLCDELWRTL